MQRIATEPEAPQQDVLLDVRRFNTAAQGVRGECIEAILEDLRNERSEPLAPPTLGLCRSTSTDQATERRPLGSGVGTAPEQMGRRDGIQFDLDPIVILVRARLDVERGDHHAALGGTLELGDERLVISREILA